LKVGQGFGGAVVRATGVYTGGKEDERGQKGNEAMTRSGKERINNKRMKCKVAICRDKVSQV